MTSSTGMLRKLYDDASSDLVCEQAAPRSVVVTCRRACVVVIEKSWLARLSGLEGVPAAVAATAVAAAASSSPSDRAASRICALRFVSSWLQLDSSPPAAMGVHKWMGRTAIDRPFSSET